MEKIIKDYKIVREIGEGGMGKVYKAIHPGLKKHVIVKQLIVQNIEIEKRFKREAEIMLNLHHDNIVTIYDYFVEDKKNYIVMEFIDGVTLSDVIKKRGKLNSYVAIYIFNEMAKGLSYAHAKGVVHRDLKPQNILISKKGEVKIIDFGIASFENEQAAGDTGNTDKTVQQDLTKTGVIIGTPAYMSPEHLSDMKNVSNATDIYSIGVIFYEMMTGDVPFGKEFTIETVKSRLNEEYVDAKRLDKGIPNAINRIIKKCLKPNPANRYKNILTPKRRLERFFKDLSYTSIRANIFEYSIRKDSEFNITGVKPIYSSFLKSFNESKRRRLALIISVILIVIISLAALVKLKDLHYRLFLRNKVGSIEIQYLLPLPRIRKLPDKAKYPGLYRKRAERAKKKLRKYIDKRYKDMLLNFQLRTWLIKTKSISARKRLSLEEIKLEPKNYISLTSDDYELQLGSKRKLSRYLILSTSLMYRPKGFYSLKVVLNNQSYISNFHLRPLKEKKKNLIIKTYHKKTPKSRVKFNFSVYNDLTGKRIKDMEIKILWRGNWTEWQKFKKEKKNMDKLTNGRSYYFKFLHPNYKTGKNLKIYAGKDQTVINISINYKEKK